MARKRKIPVRKHHGIRDPLKQLEIKEKTLKNVVNSPPQKDDQKMSYKFSQFKKLADQAKNKKKSKKIKRIRCGVEDKPKNYTSTHKKTKNLQVDKNKFKSIKMMPGEEDKDYLRRVNRITNESLKEAQYEAKYGVKVVRDPKTGAISIKKKPPNEIDELLKQKRKELKGGRLKRNRSEKDEKPMDPQLVRNLVKQAIKEDEEEKWKEKEIEMAEYRKDVIKFGETVHAPPNISALPRKAQKNETVSRPGRKNNLLLKTILNSQDVNDSEIGNSKIGIQTSNKKAKSNNTSGKSQLKGKRKDLPMATRNMLETERQKFVHLYRDLKKSKFTQLDES